MSHSFDIVASGRAYTDIIANVSPDFLARYDIPANSLKLFAADDLARIRDALTDTHMSPGGCSANTCSVVAALGGRAGFFGKVAHDEAGENCFLSDFRQRGVEMCCPPYDETAPLSATSLVLYTGEERTFAYNLGCSHNVTPDDFKDFDFAKAGSFLIEASALINTTSRATIKEAMLKARKATRVAINLQNIKTWDDAPEIAAFITAQADMLIGNEAEHETLTRATQSLTAPHNPSQLRIITRGACGVSAIQKKETIDVPAAPIATYKNDVGAGDAFTAGLLFGLSKGLELKESLGLGTQTASAILGEAGGRPTRSLTHLSPTKPTR